MANINELVERVVSKETNLLEEKVANRRIETHKALEKKKNEYREKLNLEKEKIDSKIKERYQISRQSQNIAHRDQLLTEKQSLLQEVFAAAQTALDQISTEELQAFFLDVVQQFKHQGQLMILLGEVSQEKITQAWLDTLNIEGVQLQLSPNIITQEGGFIIERGGIQYNFLNETLIQDAKTKMTVEIARLFNQ